MLREAMAIFCTDCGEKLDDAALFCTGCGQQVDRDAVVAPPPAAPSPPPADAGLPGAAPMGAAPATAAPTGGNTKKLALWMGVLVVLLMVTAGLAYVAFQRFVYGETPPVARVDQQRIPTDAPVLEAEQIAAPIPMEDSIAEQPTIEQQPAPRPVQARPAPKPAASSPTPRAAAPAKPPRPRPAPPTPNPEPARLTQPAPKPKPEPKPEQRPGAAVTPTPAPSPQPKPEPEPPPPPPPTKRGKVMLSGSEAFSPPPPKPPAPTPAPAPRVRAAPTAGDIFWSGKLDKDQEVTVDFAAGASGIGGAPLPGKPVKLEVFSPVVEIVELPGPDNGWKRFTFKATRNAKRSVTLNFHWTLAK